MEVRRFRRNKLVGVVIAFGFAWISCQHDPQRELLTDEDYIQSAYFSGGTTTVFDASPSAFTKPLNNLSPENLQRFLQGEAIFKGDFNNVVNSPFYGLGPQFIESSCVNCHVGNGRGALSSISHQGLLLRISMQGTDGFGAPLEVPYFGTQLQTNSINNSPAEGAMDVLWEYQPVVFPDGYSVVLKQPYFSISNPYHPLPEFYLRGGRHAAPIFGLGLLEAVPIATLESIADEPDQNEDGISGKLNYVMDFQVNELRPGLFGWKSSSPGILQQTADAFHQDMGITSPIFPLENCNNQSNCQGVQEGIDIEGDLLSDVVFYLRTLAPPARRNLEDPLVQLGGQLFEELKCDKCHIPELQTGIHPIAELSFQTIRPYTDMLLHELGPGLGDGRPDYLAGANEWRTPPLWGIGLTKTVFPNAGFLHDGRAETIEEAILWHEGEAIFSKQSYLELSSSQREALLRFLESL